MCCRGSRRKGPQPFLLRPSTDWLRATHIIKGILPYLMSTDLNTDYILRIPLQQHPDGSVATQLGTIA